MKFRYLSYETIYSYDLNGVVKSFDSESCFSSIFSKLKHSGPNEELRVSIIMAMTDRRNSLGKNNYCLINNSEILEFCKLISKITRIKLNVEFLNDEKIGESCKVSFRVSGYTQNQIKSVLTLIRCMYESPFSVQLKAAFLMKNIYGFKTLNFMDRFVIAMNSIREDANRYVHSIYKTEWVLVNDGLKSIRDRAIYSSMVNSLIKATTIEMRERIAIEDNIEDIESLCNGIVSKKLINKFKEMKK